MGDVVYTKLQKEILVAVVVSLQLYLFIVVL